jgi:hypothetical protein
VMRARACLHADRASRQFAEEIEQLTTRQSPADYRPAGTIDGVNLKDRLGEIKTSTGNLRGGPPGRMGTPIISSP